MAANEISERFAAACWVRCGSAGGEGINVLDPTTIRYRSRVGFQNRIITSVNPLLMPLLILPLDRVLSRVETAVYGARVATVGEHEPALDFRNSYPNLAAAAANYPHIVCQPIHLDWLGPNLSAPTFYPFGLLPGPFSVPAGLDLNLFNAIAVLLPVNGVNAEAGDFCIFVEEHFKLESTTTVTQVLPLGAPIPELNPRAWWRMDDFLSTGGEAPTVVHYNARSISGLEGNLVPTDTALPVADATFNGQLTTTTNQPLIPSSAAAFWNFMTSNKWTGYIVFAVRDGTAQDIYDNSPAAEFALTTQQGTDFIDWNFGVAGDFSLGFASALNVKNLTTILVNVDASQQITVDVTSTGENGGTFAAPPPGVATQKVKFLNQAGSGVVSLAEIILFDRVLSTGEQSTVNAYLNARYGAF